MSELRNKDGLTEEEFLKAYDDSKYKKPSVTVDMLVFTVTDGNEPNYRKLPQKVLKMLMVKRGNHPYIGQWALPGGFVSVDESLDSAALRELKEEVNIDNIYMEQLYTWGDVDRDPRSRVISCSYMSLVDCASLNIMAGDDADDAKWFIVKSSVIKQEKTMLPDGYISHDWVKLELCDDDRDISVSSVIKITGKAKGKTLYVDRQVVESDGIAFDHGKIIQYGIERLRNKIEYTDIVFNLMPPRFSLTELQQVYEVILDKKLLKANFRRKISGMVIETNELTKDVGHRPSKLYRFNPDWNKGVF
jgi:8-oxo-dGTP diphosphatase